MIRVGACNANGAYVGLFWAHCTVASRAPGGETVCAASPYDCPLIAVAIACELALQYFDEDAERRLVERRRREAARRRLGVRARKAVRS